MGNAIHLVELFRLRVHVLSLPQDHGRQNAAVFLPRRLKERTLPCSTEPLKAVTQPPERVILYCHTLCPHTHMDILFLIIEFLIKISGISRLIKKENLSYGAQDISCTKIRFFRIV